MFGFFRRKLFGPREIEVAASSGSFDYEGVVAAINDPQVDVAGTEFLAAVSPEGGHSSEFPIEDPFVAPPEPIDAGSDPQDAISFEEVALSDQMRADPFLMGLNPKLRMRPISRPDEAYTLFGTLARKHVTYSADDDYSDVEDAEIKLLEDIETAQRRYADYLQTSRVFVSEENQVPGYRRLCLLGPAHFSQPDNASVVLAVRDDGSTLAASISPVGHDAREQEALPSVAAQLEVLLHGREGWEVIPLDPKRDFDLNRHTKPARAALEAPLGKVCQDLGPRKLRYTAFHILRSKAEQRINLVRWAITRSMDPDVLRMMRGTGNTQMKHAAWLTGAEGRGAGPARDGDAERSQARQQAVQAYPILARQMYKDERLRQVIDERQRLAPAVAREFHVDEMKTKRLQGLTWQMAGATPIDTSPTVKMLLSLNEADLPTGRAQHRSLGAMAEFGRALYGINLSDFLALLGKDGDPYRFLPKIESHSADDIKDALSYMASKLYYPAALRKVRGIADEKGLHWDHRHVRDYQIVRGAMNEMLRDIKPKDLFTLSERYHRNIQRFEDRIEKLEDGQTWAPYIGTVDLGGGFTARELSSTQALKAQGRNENHCVGGYATKVMRGHLDDATLIFSIEKAGEIRGTLELSLDRRDACELDEDGDVTDETYPVTAAEELQHRAYGNEDPDDDAQAAAKQLIGIINDHDPTMFDRYVKNLAVMRDIARQVENLPSAVREIGFDPWNDDHMADAWEELSGMLPRATRKRGLAAFIEDQDISGHRFAFEVGRDVQNPWDVDHAALLKEAGDRASEMRRQLEEELEAKEPLIDDDLEFQPADTDDDLAAAW